MTRYTPRLIGALILAILTFVALKAGAAECPNHCSEDRIEAYAHMAPFTPQQRIANATPALVDAIHSVRYVCDNVLSVAFTDMPNGTVRYNVNCNGGTLRYTVDAERGRTIVYPGSL